MYLSAYRVLLLVSGGRVSGRSGVGSGLVALIVAVRLGSGSSDNGEDNNGDLIQVELI